MAAEKRGLSRLGATRASYRVNLRRIFLAYDSETLDAPIAARLRTAQFQAVTRHSRLMLLGNLVTALVIVVVAADGPRFWAAVAWALVLALFLRPLAKKRKRRDRLRGSRPVSRRTLDG